MSLAVLAACLCARGAEARPGNALFEGASQQIFGLIKHYLRKGGAGARSGVQPPALVSATATSLTVSWESVDGASSYALYADSWWANDGKMTRVYSGERGRRFQGGFII